MKVPRQNKPSAQQHILGLDIGANSVGWALVACEAGRPAKLLTTGVRVFPAGVEGVISTGQDQSRATARREARLRRRMLARRRHRLNKLALLLQEAGLLPPGDLRSIEAASTYFAAIGDTVFSEDGPSHPHLLPYRLRARALDHKLSPYDLGRALYHLAQRRGFLSTRRTATRPAQKQDDEGKVKKAISELTQRMQDSGARTLGEYLSGLNPEEERIRGPGRWLGRGMLEDEFNAIWAAQAPHHPDILTDDLRKGIHRAIFFQRPLKSQRRSVGRCELEKPRRRAALALPSSQRFRLLQKVNDLLVITPDGQRRALTPEERTALLNALETKPEMKFPQIRRLLGLARHSFNFETDGEDRLVGNRTAAKLGKVFGERWRRLSCEERDLVVEDLRSVHKPEALKRRGMKAWGLDEEAAQRFAEIPLEYGYCNLSRQALAKILPLMEEGQPYATARKEIYGEQPPAHAFNSLPPLKDVMQVRNPAVERALTELRKVVNAILRQHGKPAYVRIELARDLKRPRKQRKEITKRNAANRRSREEAREWLRKERGMAAPRPSDEDKWLLWQECNRQCPYTGRQIEAEALFGDSPQFDVEHIIPFPRCLDDSFMNKTLCEVAENRERKRKRTPWEAYGHDPDRWNDIMQRVRSFGSSAAKAKIERFQIQDLQSLDGFVSQQLNDTRYAATLAVRYLGMLHAAGGDGVDPAGTRRIQAGRGQVTYFLRNEWGLNAILGGGEKTRDDHRQHAVDAAAIALTDAATIKRLSDAAAQAPQRGRRRFAEFAPPWEGFLDDMRRAIEGLTVSHRVSRKVNAALHEETIYSKECYRDENGKQCVHVRKRVEDIKTAKEAEAIVDPVVRERVKAKLQEQGTLKGDPPTLPTKDGRQIPIRKVRMRRYDQTEIIGAGARQRRVKLGSNHHVEILETTDKKGQPRWEGRVVSTLEAMRRLRAGEAVVQCNHGPGKRFVFSLAGGEIIELDAEHKEKDACGGEQQRSRQLYVIRTVTENQKGYKQVEFAGINDARMKNDIKKGGAWGTAMIDALRRRHCRKVLVTPLGQVRWAND